MILNSIKFYTEDNSIEIAAANISKVVSMSSTNDTIRLDFVDDKQSATLNTFLKDQQLRGLQLFAEVNASFPEITDDAVLEPLIQTENVVRKMQVNCSSIFTKNFSYFPEASGLVFTTFIFGKIQVSGNLGGGIAATQWPLRFDIDGYNFRLSMHGLNMHDNQIVQE